MSRMQGAAALAAIGLWALCGAGDLWSIDGTSLTKRAAGTADLTSPGENPPPAMAAGNLINAVAHEGVAGLAITIDSDDVIYVADLFSGITYTYSIDLVPLDSFGSPGGTGVHSGLAYNPETDTLFYVDESTATPTLFETDLDGDVLATDTVVGPSAGGLIADITYDDVDGTLWGNDIVNDEYFEFELDGTLTGNVFPNPALIQERGAFGNGISHVGGTNCFDVPTGGILDGQVVRIERVDSTGAVVSGTSTLGIFDPDLIAFETFVNGNAWHATGSSGTEVNFIVGNATNVIYELDVSLGCNGCSLAGISGFACTEDGGLVSFDWENGEAYDTIELLQDGVSVATLTGTSESTTLEPGAGLYSYALQFGVDEEICTSAPCNVIVTGPGALAGQVSALAPAAADLFDLAICESNGLIYCPDLFDGICYRFDKDLALVDTIESPGLASTALWTGIAWDPASDQLFWYDATNALLISSELDGTLIDTFIMESPGAGLIGGLDINCAEDGLIAIDIATDTYYEFDFEGTATGVSFGSPISGGGFGNGVGRLPGGDGYELPVGDITVSFLGPDQIVRVDCDGASQNCRTLMGPGNFISDTFVNGVALTASGPTGSTGDFRYVLGNALGVLYAEPTTCEACVPPSALTCAFSDGEVTLEWENGEVYDSIGILRNGVLVESIDGSLVSYVDEPSTTGENRYTVLAECSSGASEFIECTIWVVPAGTTDLVWKGESAEGSIQSAEAIRDELAAIGQSAFLVEELAGIDLAPYDTVWVCLGTFPHNRILSGAEGTALSDYLGLGTAKGLYIEGGDHWLDEDLGFATAVTDDDGAAFIEDGPVICDVPSVLGLDSGVLDGLNLESDIYAAEYDCEGGFVDYLAPDGTTGIGAVLQSTGSGAQNVVIYHDGLASIGLDFRTIASSIEFGGYLGDSSSLMAAYYGALTGEPVVVPGDDLFLRGDGNGNGSVSALLDALYLLVWQFQGGPAPPCMKAADADGSGGVTALLDALFLLVWTFQDGPAPPAPGPDDCGSDDSDLTCESPLDPPC